jgi:uncharacterized membrane protein
MHNTEEISSSSSLLFRILLFLQRIMNLFRTIKREDNVVSSVYRLIKAYKVKISINAVVEFLKPHKDYPSLKSICDFFNEINLENYPVRVEVEDLYSLPKPFLVHVKVQSGRVLVIYKITKEYVIYSDSINGKKVIEIQKFLEHWDGVIIVVQPSKGIADSYQKQRYEDLIDKSILPITIFLLIILGLSSSHNFYNLESEKHLVVSILFLHSTGLLFSILLARNEMNLKNQITEKLCHFSTLTDCDAVTASNASKLFSYITWADIGIAWFAAGLSLMFIVRESWIFNVITILSLASIPYPIYSILYQKIRLRKWCPLCLAVQTILIAEFILLLGYAEIIDLTVKRIAIPLIVLNATLIIELLIKRNLLLKKDRDEIKLELLRMKRDPDVFISKLLSSVKICLPSTEPTILFGKTTEKVTVTVFLSLFCSACARQFPEILKLTGSLKNVCIQIVISPGRDELTMKWFRILSFYLKAGKQEKVTVLLSEWYSLDPESRKNLFDKYKEVGQPEDADFLIKRSELFFETGKVESVPAIFIDGYRLPLIYRVEDLKYLLNETEIFENERELVKV